ncbi:hydroxycarboxylic acid receptor 2-like [Polymixia lowei]
MSCNFNGTLLISVLPPLLLTEFTLGVLGNGLALWIFCFHLKPWKSSTVFLFNLALADFLLNAALPFRASYYLSGLDWKFGGAFCNIALFMLAMNRGGSILFLMAVAIDRYIRVVHPHHSINSLSVSKAACAALALWSITISMTVHLLPTARQSNTSCESFNIQRTPSTSLIWHKFLFLFSFYLPLVVILYCTFHIIGHLRGRQLAQQARIKKALFFIMIVVILFIICFLPSNIAQILIWFKVASYTGSQFCEDMENLNTVFYITISLTYLNSMLDPLVYYFSSPAFKNYCRRAIHIKPVKDTVESSEKKTKEPGTQSISQL